MAGVALELPQDVTATRDGVMRFVETEVAPRIEKNHALLEDQRQLYEDSGRYSAKVPELAHQRAQAVDLERADRGMVHRVCDHRSREGREKSRRHQRIHGADQRARLPCRECRQVVRPYWRP